MKDLEPEPEPLYVNCRNCGSPVPTGLRLTSAVYEIEIEEQHELTCPNCGTVARYTKVAFHILPTGVG
jgi:RNase P subunit RPR2